MIVYLSTDGFVAKLVRRLDDDDVRVRSDVSFEDALQSRWPAPHIRTGKKCFASVVAKHLSGDGMMGMHVDASTRRLAIVPESRNSSFIITAPRLYIGVSDQEAALLQKGTEDTEDAKTVTPPPVPPWIVCIISGREPEEALGGLDEDPIIAAKGVADSILRAGGVIDYDPSVRYRAARRELEEAILTVNAQNEKAIHLVIEQRPWILMHEAEFSGFSSEVPLPFTERREEDGAMQTVQRTITPDFLYDLYDSTLVVEIEAATKQLLKQTKETTLQLPTAETVAAQYQIQNYRQICDGPMGSEIRTKLEKPDIWDFSYLLVVGSSKQPQFDERSWQSLRQALPSDILLRNWDFYIDRLRRLEDAATFSDAGPPRKEPNKSE